MADTRENPQSDPRGQAESELRAFDKLWRGGYLEGDPLDRMGDSHYRSIGYNSVLYTVFAACIKPFVNRSTTALEIGPGRGGWTKAILSCNPASIVALDAAPAEHTGFWSYVGRDPRARYCVAQDFTLSDIPHDSISYFFSFGVFCHIPPALSADYIRNLFPRMTRGGHGFLMVADFAKFNAAANNSRAISLRRALIGKGMAPLRALYDLVVALFPQKNLRPIPAGVHAFHAPLRWHHFGTDAACDALRQAGFTILDRDMEVTPRDPMIHFVKE
jgi:hypothetical protein